MKFGINAVCMDYPGPHKRANILIYVQTKLCGYVSNKARLKYMSQTKIYLISVSENVWLQKNYLFSLY